MDVPEYLQDFANTWGVSGDLPNTVTNAPAVSSIDEKWNLSGKQDDLLNILQTQDSPESALSWLKENNPELYYQLLAERDQNRDFWQQYADYQRNYYSLQKESLEKAGMNPWLALQNFGSIGTGSVGSSSVGNATSTLKAQREAKSNEIAGKFVSAGGAIIGAIIGALVMAML